LARRKIKLKPQKKEELLALHVDQKVERSKSVIREAIEGLGVENMAIAITRSKDSTMNLCISKRVCDEMGLKYVCVCF
jgi:hypothetical protein